MKKIVFFLLLGYSGFSQIYIHRDNVTQRLNRQTGKYEYTHTYDSTLMQPNWQGFKDDIAINPVFLQLMPSANSNGYSTFLDYINSGINGTNDINRFLLYWNLMGLTLTTEQRNTINTVLTKNFFAVQL